MTRAIESFLRQTRGDAVWAQAVRGADLGFDSFEPMLSYTPDQADAVLSAAQEVLGIHRDALLDDIGTFVVSHPSYAALRRLLRFGGDVYVDFLLSLDDLPDRARLAVPDLEIPSIQVKPERENVFDIHVAPGLPGFAQVMVGVLRSMADDYGALVFIECGPEGEGGTNLTVSLHELDFAEGRHFALSRRSAI